MESVPTRFHNNVVYNCSGTFLKELPITFHCIKRFMDSYIFFESRGILTEGIVNGSAAVLVFIKAFTRSRKDEGLQQPSSMKKITEMSFHVASSSESALKCFPNKQAVAEKNAQSICIWFLFLWASFFPFHVCSSVKKFIIRYCRERLKETLCNLPADCRS